MPKILYNSVFFLSEYNGNGFLEKSDSLLSRCLSQQFRFVPAFVPVCLGSVVPLFVLGIIHFSKVKLFNYNIIILAIYTPIMASFTLIIPLSLYGI